MSPCLPAFVVPDSPSRFPGDQMTRHQQMPAGQIKTLLADDDPIFAEIASAALRGRGCSVVVAKDGGAAFDALLHDGFHVAIVDLSMPDVDGFRLIALVRATPHLAHLPIMVVTVRDDAEAIEEALRLGADSFTTKPVDWHRLYEQIVAMVSRRRSEADQSAL